MTLRTSLAIMCLISFVSCSVKEIRHGCPCILSVDLREIPKENGEITLIVDNAAELYDSHIDPMKEQSGIVQIKVPKGTNHIICAQGLPAARVYDVRNVIIPIGEECSTISLTTEAIECSEESQYYKPVLHKEWAELVISYDSGNLSDYPYSFIVDGNIKGIDIHSGKSLNGKFSCEAVEDRVDKNEVSVRLPRQNTEKPGLRLSLVSKEDYSVWKEYDLSKIIADTGFDWEKADLDDIRIHLDYSGQLSGITVIDWETGIATNITI